MGKYQLTLLYLFICVAVCVAEDGVNPNEKAARYFEILENRPENGYIFDRFYNEWLKKNSVEDLEAFLVKQSAERKDATSLILLGMFYEKEGDDAKALSEFAAAVGKSPSSKTYYLKANLEMFNLDFPAAIADLEAALACKQTRSEIVKIKKLLGKAYLRDGQQDKALATWESLLACSVDDINLKEDIVELLLEEGLTSKALETCKALIETSSENYRLLMLRLKLAEVYIRMGQTGEALEVYRGTLSTIEGDSWLEKEVLSKIEKIFRQQDDLKGLLKFYDSLMESQQSRIGLLRRRGSLLFEAGMTEQGIKAFEHLMELTPGDRSVREQYARNLVRADKLAQAILVMQELARQHPEDGELSIQLAGMFHRAKQGEKVLAELQKYLDGSDKSQFAYLRTARLMSYYNLSDAAGRVYAEMLKAYPESVSGRESHAIHLWRTGKKEQAEREVLSLARGGGEDAIIRSAERLSGWGRKEQALKLLQDNRSRFPENFTYLSHLAHTATMCKQYELAMDINRRRLGLADNIMQISSAVTDTIFAAKLAGKTDELAGELQEIDSKAPGEYCLIAELNCKTAPEAQTLKIIDEGLNAHPGSALLWVQRYRLANRFGMTEAASDALQKLLHLQPKRRISLLKNLGELALKAGLVDETVKWAREWKKASPGQAGPWLLEARAYWGQMQTEKAIKTLNSANMKFPANREVLTCLKNFHEMLNNDTQAGRILWQLFELEQTLPGKLDIVSDLAANARTQGKQNALIRHFQTRCENNRESVFPLLALARIYQRLDDYGNRIKYLRRAAELRNYDLLLLQEIARIEEEEGDYENAAETLKKAAAIDKSNKTRIKLAQLYMSMGEQEQGYAILTELLTDREVDPQTAEGVVDMLIGTDQIEQALAILDRVTASYPQNYRLGFFRAVALLLNDQPDKSLDECVRLLEINREIPGIVSKKSSSVQARTGRSRLQTLFPPGVLELAELGESGRNMNRFYKAGYYGRTRQKSVIVPRSLDALKPAVLGVIRYISNDMDEKRIETLAADLEAKGVKDAKFAFEFKSDSMRNHQAMMELCKKYPDNKSLYALTYCLISQRSDDIDTTFLEEGFKRFKDNWPMLAVLPVVAHLSNENIDQKLTLEAFELLLEQIGRGGNYGTYGIMLLDRGFGNVENFDGKKVGELISALAKKYHDKPELQQYDELFGIVLKSIVATENYEEFIKLLNQAALEKPSTKKQSLPYFHILHGHPTAGPVRPLNFLFEFPPSYIPGLPEKIGAIFLSNNPGGIGFVRTNVGQMEVDEDKFARYLGKLENRIIRILLALQFADQTQAEKLLKELAREPSPSLGELVLLASWKNQAGDYLGAVEFLSKASELKTDKTSREYIDGVLLGILAESEGIDIKKLSSEAAAESRQALKRLIQRLKNNEHQEAIIALCKKLDMNDQAAELEKQLARIAASSAMRSGGGVGGRGSVRGRYAPPQDVGSLVRKGRKDLAAKKLAKEFREYAREVSGNTPYYMTSQSHYKANELLGEILNHKLKAEFLAEVKPASDSTAVRQLQVYAQALEMLNDPAAEENYQKILKLSPNDARANMFMAKQLIGEHPDKAEQHLLAIGNQRKRMQCGRMLVPVFDHRSEASLEERGKALRLCTMILGHDKSLQNDDISWVSGVFSGLDDFTHNDEQYWGIFEGRAWQGFLSAKIDKKLRDDYLQVVDEFLRKAMHVPGIQDEAFNYRQKIMRVKGGDKSELFDDAMTAVRAKAETIVYYYSPCSSGDEFQLLTPEAFLIRYAMENDKQAELDGFVAELAKGSTLRLSKKLQKMIALRVASDDDFLAEAEKVLKASNARSLDEISEQQLFEIWELRKSKPVLTKLLLERFKSTLRSSGYLETGVVVRWADLLWKYRTPKETRDFVVSICDMFFPRRERLAAASQPASRPTARITARSSRDRKKEMLSQILGQMCNLPELQPIVVEVVIHEPGIYEDNFGNMGSQVEEFYRQAGRDIELFKKTSLAGDLDDFRIIKRPNYPSSLSCLVSSMTRNITIQKRKEMLEGIKSIEPQTFGTGLIALIMESPPSPNKVAEYLGTFETGFQNLPEVRRREILAGLADYMKNVRKAKLSDPARRMAEIFHEDLLVRLDEQVADFMKRKVRGGNTWDYSQNAAELIRTLIEESPENTEKVYTHAVNVLKRASRRHNWQDISEVEGELLREICDKWDCDIQVLVFANRKLQSKDSTAGRETIRSIISFTRDKTSRMVTRYGFNVKGADRAKALIRVLEFVEKNWASVHFPETFALCNNFHFNEEENLYMMDWFKKPGHDKSIFLREAQAILAEKFHRLRGEPTGKDKDIQVACQMEMLADENISPNWRIYFCLMNMGRFGSKDVTPLILPLMKLIASQKIPGRYVTSQAGYFNDLPITDEWKTLATRICDSWRGNRFSERDNSESTSFAIGEMLLRCGRTEDALRILRDRENNVGRQLESIYYMLLEYPQAVPVIAELLQRNWENLTPNQAAGHEQCRLDSNRRQNANAVINSLNKPDIQYFAKIFYAYGDVCDNRKKNRQHRERTLNKLAAEFGGVKFSNSLLRKKCLDSLPKTKVMLPAVYSEYEKVDPVELVMSGEVNFDDKNVRNYLSYLKSLLSGGKLDTFEEKLSLLIEASKDKNMPSRGDERLSRMIAQLVNIYANFIMPSQQIAPHNFSRDSQEQVRWANSPEELLASGERINKLGDGNFGKRQGPFRQAVWALYLICDRPADAGGWLESTKPADNDPRSHRARNMMLRGSMMGYGGSMPLMSPFAQAFMISDGSKDKKLAENLFVGIDQQIDDMKGQPGRAPRPHPSRPVNLPPSMRITPANYLKHAYLMNILMWQPQHSRLKKMHAELLDKGLVQVQDDLRKNPANGRQVLPSLIQILVRQKRTEKISPLLAVLQDQLQQNSENSAAFDLLISCYYQLGRYEEARALRKKHCKIKTTPEMYRNWAGKMPDPVLKYDLLCEGTLKYPEDALLYKYLGRAAAALQKWQDAEKGLSKYLELSKTFGKKNISEYREWMVLAEICERSKAYDRALQYANKAITFSKIPNYDKSRLSGIIRRVKEKTAADKE